MVKGRPRKRPRPHRVNPTDPRYSNGVKATGYPRGSGGETSQSAQSSDADFDSTYSALKRATSEAQLLKLLRKAEKNTAFDDFEIAELKQLAEKRRIFLKDLRLKPLNTETYKELHVTIIGKEERERLRTPYRYLVKVGAVSHTGFRTKQGFDKWMQERGLSLGRRFSMGNSHVINGSYKKTSYRGTQNQLDKVAKGKKYKPIAVLSNGEYVRGYVKGGNEVLYINPNYPRRTLKYRRP